MTTKRILWVDDKPFEVRSLVEALQDNGYCVSVEGTLTGGEAALAEEAYDLLILDVMMPPEKDTPYTEEATRGGLESGVLFYERTTRIRKKQGTAVLVFTILMEQDLRDKFVHRGLPEVNFKTRYALRNTPDFLKRVQVILGNDGR